MLMLNISQFVVFLIELCQSGLTFRLQVFEPLVKFDSKPVDALKPKVFFLLQVLDLKLLVLDHSLQSLDFTLESHKGIIVNLGTGLFYHSGGTTTRAKALAAVEDVEKAGLIGFLFEKIGKGLL